MISFLLSACSGFSPVAEDLMRPPRLTEEQKAIEEALRGSIGSNSFSFKYPRTGDYRSAFIFHDVDGDGEDEAFVFYVTGNQQNDSCMAVLDKQPDGSWRSDYTLYGPQPDVEFIAFANITGSQSADIVIGWSGYNSSAVNNLGVYTYRDKQLEKRLDGSYTYETYLIDDLDEDGADDILLFSPDSGKRVDERSVRLLGFDGYDVTLINELPLSDSLLRYAGVKAGLLSPGQDKRAVFLDELLVGNTMVTEVFTKEDGQLVPVIHSLMAPPELVQPGRIPLGEVSSGDRGGETEDPETGEEQGQPVSEYTDLVPVETPLSLYDRSRRADLSALCQDVNGDGVIEIPLCAPLPGYEQLRDTAETDWLYLVQYNQLRGGDYHQVLAVVINREAGYQLRFPEKWIGKVTISRQIESNEWHILTYKPDSRDPLEDRSGELGSVRVVSQKDYQDKFLENYRVFGVRGTFTYYGNVPETAKGPLAVSLDELEKDIFALL